MRTRAQTPAPRPGFGSIRADEVLPLAELGRRLGMGNKTLAAIQRDGLRAVQVGKRKYCLGSDVLVFFQDLANRAEGQG